MSNSIDRNASWLQFNQRVLTESMKSHHPYGEQLRFLSIYESNLTEFMQVKMGELVNELVDPNTLITRRSAIDDILKGYFGTINTYYEKSVVNQFMGLLGDKIIRPEQWSSYNKEVVSKYFESTQSMLTTYVVDNVYMMPFIRDDRVYVCVQLMNKDNETVDQLKIGLVEVPKQRFFKVNDNWYLMMDDLIEQNIAKIFPDYVCGDTFTFRIIRSGDFKVPNGIYENVDGLKEGILNLVESRSAQQVVCFEHTGIDMNGGVQGWFATKLNLKDYQFNLIEDRPLDLTFINKIISELPSDQLYPAIRSVYPKTKKKGKSLIKYISENDMLLVHPYNSMKPVVDLLEEAAVNRSVSSIKMTLYRLADNSRIINALIRAAERGKDVTVIIELKARFDEKHNIEWSNKLEQAGCHVMYGFDGYKVHAKLLQITYFKNNKFHHITHIGTGNFNEKTSSMYTDMSLLTGNKEIAFEVDRLFKYLLNGNFVEESNHLLIAPKVMKGELIKLIDNEIKNAIEGKNARIIIKVNSLTHPEMITKLQEAAIAGVYITLFVRGMCCIRPLAPEIDNGCNCIVTAKGKLEVFSVVGRHLEHSRIYSFGVGKKQKLYIGSADWMERNLDKRVEVAVEILDKSIKKKINKIVDMYMNDTENTYIMWSSGLYGTLCAEPQDDDCGVTVLVGEDDAYDAHHEIGEYIKRKCK